jgi:hypothetical protein
MQPVHGTGIIEFGLLTDPAATVTRSITYTNDGPDSIELDLTTSLQRPDANFGWPHTVYEPPPGLLSVPDTVSVPAGESRTIDIVLDLALSPEASVFGDVVATSADGTTQVRTTLTWTRSAPLHRLEVDFFDRRGDQPQEGLVFGSSPISTPGRTASCRTSKVAHGSPTPSASTRTVRCCRSTATR